MLLILDAGRQHRRIRQDIVLEINGQIDEPSAHQRTPCVSRQPSFGPSPCTEASFASIRRIDKIVVAPIPGWLSPPAMKLATLRDGTPDGQLLVVSRDLRRAVKATGVA